MMRHINAILLASLLAACGSAEQPTDSPMPYMAPDAKVTFMSVDPDGKAISQDVDGTTFNRLLKSRLAKQAAYQRGEPESTEQAVGVTFVGNTGQGCVYWGCPADVHAICLDTDTWLYNMNYGYAQNPWSQNLVIGCWRGTTWSEQLYQPTWSNPASPNQNNWAYGVRSSWAGVKKVCWSSSTDYWQAPTIPTYCSQPYEQRDFGTWYGVYQVGNNNTPRALVRMYQYP